MRWNADREGRGVVPLSLSHVKCVEFFEPKGVNLIVNRVETAGSSNDDEMFGKSGFHWGVCSWTSQDKASVNSPLVHLLMCCKCPNYVYFYMQNCACMFWNHDPGLDSTRTVWFTVNFLEAKRKISLLS